MTQVSDGILQKIEQDRQRRRLDHLVHGKTAIPFEAYLDLFRSWFAFFSRSPLLGKYLSFLEVNLSRANLSRLSPKDLLGYQVLGACGSAAIFGFLSGSVELVLISFGAGLALPVVWLGDKAQKRERELLRELPNALEVFALCSEAGLSLEQSMEQYLKNAKPGALRDEVAKIVDQTRSGSSRKKAFVSVTEKLNLTDFSLFTTSVIQAERFGTGIAKTLQQLSLTIRDKQSQRAEKAVQEMPVKLLFPLIFCIMPVTFLIIFGPVLLQFLGPR